MRARLWIWLLVAYAAATAVHVGYVTAHEPFAFDAWNVAVDTRAEPATVSRFFAFWWDQYTHANPRLGQPLTYLTYKLAWFAPIATPLALLALASAVAVLGLGRRPRTWRDAALCTVALGWCWFVLPQLGRNLFCRAYAANYVYTAALQLWFLVPLRLVVPGDATTPRVVLYGIAGVVAGLCNEHTGPALVAGLLALAWRQRRGGLRPRLALAGAIGAALGFAALFFAPGQDQRYGELAQQLSLPMRLWQRGLGGNLDIVREYLTYAAPLLAILVLLAVLSAATSRSHLRLVGLALLAGFVMTATLFVSPKLGSRFHIVPMALLLAAVIRFADAAVPARAIAAMAALAGLASAYAVLRTVPLYTRVAAQGAARMAALEATRPGEVYVAEAWDQVDESWWYIGDDFRDWRKRELVARYFDLARVYFRGYDVRAPLGLSGTRLAAVYTLTGEAREHTDDSFDLGVTRGFDIAGIQSSAASAIAYLQRHLPPGQRLETYEVRVVLAGPPPAWPRPQLLVARWSAGVLEAPAGRITRQGRSTARGVSVPAALQRPATTIHAVQVGGQSRELGPATSDRLQYTPWRSGVYWILGCDATRCWVLAATRHSA